jgi:RimJ/RimL family protein N-acetyltransferase
MNYQDLFQCLKGVGKLDLSGLSLPVLGTRYALCPICCHAKNTDKSVIGMLTDARNANVNSFLTFFTATVDRTSQWLVDSVANDCSRVLFALRDIESGSLYGYMGLACGDVSGARIEGDAIVRHSEQTEPGLMQAAFMQLIGWAMKDLGIKEVWIRVLSDNPALRFYQRCNFVPFSEAPLYEFRNIDNEIEALTEYPDSKCRLSSRTLVYMKYLPVE